MTVSQFLIPTVDISAYLADHTTSRAQDVVAQIRYAWRTSGFFQITGHGIPGGLQTQVFEAAKLIFDLPVEEKLKLKGGNGRGYETIGGQTLEVGKKPDLKEVCGL
jgi:isopenicillin N synthase-like dioxygenase